MEKIRKFNKNINKIIKKYGIIVEFILVLIFLIFSYQLICDKKYFENISIYKLCISIILFIIIIRIIFIQTRYYYKTLEKMFLIFVIPLGLAFLIFELPGYVYDESTHIVRAYDISNGNLISKKDNNGMASIEIPKQYKMNASRLLNNSYKNMNEAISEKFNYNETIETSSVTGHAFILYIPTSITFFIGRLINLNFFIVIYLARLVNFIIFLIAGYFSIKKIPFGKLILFVYLFIPMVIHQACSITVDSLINSLLIFFLVYNLYLFKSNIKLTKKHIIYYYILTVFVVISKIAYFPLVFLSLLIFNKKEIRTRTKIIFLSGLLIMLAVGAIITYSLMMSYEDYRNYEDYNNINSNIQLLNILTNPYNYIKVLFNTVIENSYIWLQLFIGISPGHAFITVNSFIILIYIIMLVISVFYGSEKILLNKKEKILLVCIFVFSSINILSGLYMVWTPLGASIIQGVNGRYFIPIIILLLLTLKNKETNIKSNNIVSSFIIGGYLVNIDVLLNLIKYFLI